MKFDELYNSVYIVEAEAEEKTLENETPETEGTSSVPMPEDFDDVEPLPQPANTDASAEGEDTNVPADSQPTAATLKDYIFQLEDFADKLNGMDGSSLQSLVASLDRPGTPFDGVSARTKADIVSVAETLLSISEKLKSFMINAIKR